MNKKSNDRYIRKNAKKKCIVDAVGGKCIKCGEARLHLLNFHHVNPEHKEFAIGSRDHRLSNIFNESGKCELLCYNCHMELHYSLNEKSLRRIRYKETMLDYLKTNSCSKCGYDTCLGCLDFHHVNTEDKQFKLSTMRSFIGGLTDDVKNELDKCIVLCSNCHHDLHFDSDRFEENKDLIIRKSKNIKEISKKIDRSVVYEMYVNQNMKQIDIAKHFNASKGTINGILKSFNLTNKLEDVMLDKTRILKLHGEGLTCSEIAKSLNENRLSVRNIILTAGLEPNLIKNRKPVNYEFGLKEIIEEI